MLFTNRTVGALCASASSPSVDEVNVAVSSEALTSRRISSMARAAPSLPYSVMIARWIASLVATIGTTRLRDAVFTASMARKLSGSLMARKTSSGVALTGTTPYVRATFFEMTLLISGSMSYWERSMNSMPSCI